MGEGLVGMEAGGRMWGEVPALVHTYQYTFWYESSLLKRAGKAFFAQRRKPSATECDIRFRAQYEEVDRWCLGEGETFKDVLSDRRV